MRGCAFLRATREISTSSASKLCLLCLLLMVSASAIEMELLSLGEHCLFVGGMFVLLLRGEEPEAGWAALGCRALTSGEAVGCGARSSAKH